MARTGHGQALQEHRLGFGHQVLPSGLSAFPLPRKSEHHRSITQSLPELWSDFSDRGATHARERCAQSMKFHGDSEADDAARSGVWLEQDAARLRAEIELRKENHQDALRKFRYDRRPRSDGQQRLALQGFQEERAAIRTEEQRLKELESRPELLGARRVLFVGYAEFDMDGRTNTAGEMDRLMLHAACSKYPCARPATFDEFSDGCIVGLPSTNLTGRDIVFAGPGATGCELNHTNTLGAQKAMVPAGDSLDGTWGAASMYGRKCIVCVVPMQRVQKQQSLLQFGLARESIGKSGKLRRAGSLTCMSDTTRWTNGGYGLRGSTNVAQHMSRTDSFFR